MARCMLVAALSLLASSNLAFAQAAANDPTPPASPPAVESPNAPEPMEDTQVGDHWTYELRDDITGEIKSTITNTVTDVSASEIGMRIAQLGNTNSGYQTFDRSWNLITNGIWRFTPNDGGGIRSPLAMGKTWPIKSTDLNSTAGVSIKRSGTTKVTAKETVTTRAGTFDTFKIEASYMGQSASDPTKKWQVELQTWYAPAINHWVKRSFVSRSDGRVRERNTTELVEYGRR